MICFFLMYTAIVITAAPTYAYYGENVTLVCTVFGNLSDPLIWEVPTNSTSLSRGNIDNGSMDSILTFIAFEDDSGVYSCRHADFITSIIVTIGKSLAVCIYMYILLL